LAAPGIPWSRFFLDWQEFAPASGSIVSKVLCSRLQIQIHLRKDGIISSIDSGSMALDQNQ